MADRPVYKEQTWAPAWFWVVMWGACLMGIGSMAGAAYSNLVVGGPLGTQPAPAWVHPASAITLLLVPLAITLLAARLDVEVWDDSVLVAFGPARILRKTIALGQIEGVEAITYRPLRDFGGWGIRFRPGKTAWTIRGDKAVNISLTTGKQVYVGSRFPHRLAERIQLAQLKHAQRTAG